MSNSLEKEFPQIALEWDYVKNSHISLKDITGGSGKKVWWKCEKNHSWESTVGYRTSKMSPCPYCSNKRLSEDYNLEKVFPDIANEWHPTKNGELLPKNVMPSVSQKVWWLCKEGHDYYASINHRTHKVGATSCPVCSGRIPTEKTCLSALYPDICKEWNYEKNVDLLPSQVSIKSNREVWWRCQNGHEWKALISSRTAGKGSCRKCRLSMRSLGVKFPELSKQWDTKRNGVAPEDVFYGTNKKFWWTCESGHSWEASPANRTKGHGCPICHAYLSTSKPELRLYFELLGILGEERVKHRRRVGKYECDVFIEGYSIGIDYDGEFWHRGEKAYKHDKTKSDYLKRRGIKHFRVREYGLPKINKDDIVRGNYESDHFWVSLVVSHISNMLVDDVEISQKFVHYLSSGMLCNQDRYAEHVISLNFPVLGRTFLDSFPQLCEEWSFEDNALGPEKFAPKSNKKVWWLCNKGHKWESSISNRVRGNGCPYCSGHRVCKENSVVNNSLLVQDWHPTRNGTNLPEHFTMNSKQKVWWTCVCGNEWQTSILARNSGGTTCPKCSKLQWTLEERYFLETSYQTMSADEISQKLLKNKVAVENKISSLITNRKNNYWTKGEDEYLYQNYLTGPTKEISEKLRRTVSAVTQRANLLGLQKRTKEK